MSSKSLYLWIRFAIIAIAFCGLSLCIWMPFLDDLLIQTNPVNGLHLWSWTIFFWLVAIPCFTILVFVWDFSNAIKSEEVFSMQSAKQVKLSAQILLADVIIFMIGNIIFALLKIISPLIAVISVFLVIAGIVLVIFAIILSHYIIKGAILREENEGTI